MKIKIEKYEIQNSVNSNAGINL